MAPPDTLELAHRACAEHAWADAFEALRVLDWDDLAAGDLERRAVAAYLTGHRSDAVATMERLHHRLLDDQDVPGAVGWAVWLAMLHFMQGSKAQGSGWMARAQRLLDEVEHEGPEHGMIMVPQALQALGGGDPAAALAIFQDIVAIAERFRDRDLTALGLLGCGQALVAMGEVAPGLAWLDEAMVAVTTADVLPIVTGIAYCAVIVACRDIFDIQRAQEWTAALSRWCRRQQGLHPYRGQCLVHRSEIMALRGEWHAAMDEVEAATTHLAALPGDPVTGMAHYQLGELQRLRGDLDEAEAAYRQADQWGHPVHPGLALLRLAQGRVDDAAVAIRRVMDEAHGDHVRRSAILAAHVEIMLVAGDVEEARAGMGELEAIADDFDSLYLQAQAARCRGAVCLAVGDPRAARDALRLAWRCWHQLDAPYEAACVRLLMGRALRALGDHDTADMEVDAARQVFHELGAEPALAEATGLARRAQDAAPGGLTPREVEVLRVVATGATNHEVADDLVISEKTVARHLSNMFTKLDVTSRAAATAWAYEHDLV